MVIGAKTDQCFVELNDWKNDKELLETVRECIDLQWHMGKEQFGKYHTSPKSDEYVSEEALNEILATGQDISDIRTHQELSNCIVFHTKNLDGSLINEDVIALRKKADNMIAGKIRTLFEPGAKPDIEMSGHFWYPKGGFMGWHTNLRKPGWRMYVNYATEENKSFFRYRDPMTGEIVTSWDKHWNFRLFIIDAALPFWHCVHSETDRFSLGYKITLA
jgi:hypothetical protein